MDGYGIIPPPKYDESQNDYITYIPAEVAGIPYVVTNDEMSRSYLRRSSIRHIRMLFRNIIILL